VLLFLENAFPERQKILEHDSDFCSLRHVPAGSQVEEMLVVCFVVVIFGFRLADSPGFVFAPKAPAFPHPLNRARQIGHIVHFLKLIEHAVLPRRPLAFPALVSGSVWNREAAETRGADGLFQRG